MNQTELVKFLKDLNEASHVEFRKQHTKNVSENIRTIFEKQFPYYSSLGIDIDTLTCAAYAHDLCKNLVTNEDEFIFNYDGVDYKIPTDARSYVRKNIDVLTEFNLDFYFNSDAGYHGLAAGIWLVKTFNRELLSDELLYSVMMHTCPIIDIYNTLTEKTKACINLLIIADKLDKSKRSHIAYQKYDLSKILFGLDNRQFNESLALFTIRYLEADKKRDGIEARNAYDYFYDVLIKENPFLERGIKSPYK